MKESPTDPAEHRGYLRFFYHNWRPTRLGRIWSKVFAWISGLGITPEMLVTLRVKDRRSGQLSSTILVAACHQNQRYLVSMLRNDSEWVRSP